MFRFPKPKPRKQLHRLRGWSDKFVRPWIEPLEERMLLDAGLPAALVVGRTLSAYFTSDVQKNQETITYTVYNEQADDLTGVLLTDTLQPGVTFANASPVPDQSGQTLAWSLGTIQGYDRASATLTVTLATPTPLQLDTGAQAFGTVDAGAVSNTTPAATLRPGTDDPTLLASTPDANTTDPYIQEEAAKLSYDPQQIFDFLHTQIGFNSYVGSLRGARGTLWSDAGNALDVASLGVALMRSLRHPGPVRFRHARPEPGPAAHPVDVPCNLSNRRRHPSRNAIIRSGERSAIAVGDGEPLLVSVRCWERNDGRRSADGRSDGGAGVHCKHGHVCRGGGQFESEDRDYANGGDL